MISKLSELLQPGYVVVFLFHGVFTESQFQIRNYNKKHLPIEYFSSFLRECAVRARAVSMNEVVEHHKRNQPYSEPAFAVTFDDGFENNFTIAAPVLRALGIPATFYVTTAFIEDNLMSWIDQIEQCVENAEQAEVKLDWHSSPMNFQDEESKIAFLDEIRRHVKTHPEIDKSKLIQSICHQCGQVMVTSATNQLDKKMSWEQLRSLNQDTLFAVGGHTHTHQVMSHLSKEELQKEISTSCGLLEKHLGIKCRHYSYPEGLVHCFNDEVIRALQKEGIECCPTAIPGVNDCRTDLFLLRRVPVT